MADQLDIGRHATAITITWDSGSMVPEQRIYRR
jgi:hypothetical protein